MNRTSKIASCALVATCALSLAVAPASSRATTAAGASGIAAAEGARSIGTGETLIVLVAGEFPTAPAAQAANDRLAFEDVQGFIVAQTGDFAGLTPGRFALVTAFRTVTGANEFEPLARGAGAAVRRVVSRYTGTVWIGLGQEAHPDGSGPLTGPLPPGHPARIG